jgi:hypothetical protein
MALAFGAHIPSLDSLVNPQFAARSFPILQTRQRNSTSGAGNSTQENDENTVNIFIDGISEDIEYGASVINVCDGTTTMALQCLAPSTLYVPELRTSVLCGTDAEVSLSFFVMSTVTDLLYQKFTATIASDYYAVSSSTNLGGTTASIAETCSLQGTTAAVCQITISGAVGGQTISTATSATASGADYYRYNVPITAGAEKTASPGTCAGGNGGASGANPTNSAGGGNGGTSAGATFNTKAMAVWGFFGFATFATMIVL